MTPIALALTLSGAAQATELVYVPAEHTAYRLQLALSTPYGNTWLALENVDARAWKVGASMVIDCTHEGSSSSCEVLRATFVGSAPEAEQADLDTVLEEYARLVADSTIQVEWHGLGRVRSIDIEGVPKSTSREAVVQEHLRMLVSRAFSPLELELPKGGDDKGKSWKQRGHPLALRLVEVSGTTGGVKLLHEVVGEEDGLLLINSAGEGIVQSGLSIENGANQTVSMMMAGQAKFDPARGLVVYNKEVVQGVFTAQSGRIGSGLVIDHMAEAMLLEDLDGFLAKWDAEMAGEPEPVVEESPTPVVEEPQAPLVEQPQVPLEDDLAPE